MRILNGGLFANRLKGKDRYLGYRYAYFDGDFHDVGFWFFQVYWTNNPLVYLTDEEIEENLNREKLK